MCLMCLSHTALKEANKHKILVSSGWLAGARYFCACVLYVWRFQLSIIPLRVIVNNIILHNVIGNVLHGHSRQIIKSIKCSGAWIDLALQNSRQDGDDNVRAYWANMFHNDTFSFRSLWINTTEIYIEWQTKKWDWTAIFERDIKKTFLILCQHFVFRLSILDIIVFFFLLLNRIFKSARLRSGAFLGSGRGKRWLAEIATDRIITDVLAYKIRIT